MNQIKSDPKTLPCLHPGCRFGRIWKAGTVQDVNEAIRRANLRIQKASEYFEETDECPVCKGSGEIPIPELKRGME